MVEPAFVRIDETEFRSMQHRLVWQLLVEGKTPDEVREVVDFMPGFDMITLQKLATAHPDLHGFIEQPDITTHRELEKSKPDLLEYCQECSEVVAKWPDWKRRGADVTL